MRWKDTTDTVLNRISGDETLGCIHKFRCKSTNAFRIKKEVKGHPCTGTEALYKPYGP